MLITTYTNPILKSYGAPKGTWWWNKFGVGVKNIFFQIFCILLEHFCVLLQRYLRSMSKLNWFCKRMQISLRGNAKVLRRKANIFARECKRFARECKVSRGNAKKIEKYFFLPPQIFSTTLSL